MNQRDDVLKAVKKASKLTDEYKRNPQTAVDVLEIYQDKDITVLFRPLENLLGGAVSINDSEGVLVHAGVPRELQRFTLAHELGHILLEHKNEFDDKSNLIGRKPDHSNSSSKEVAANKFASELLAPYNLIRENAERLGLRQSNLADPTNIYQISLRLDISFKATCWALFENDLLSFDTVESYTNEKDILKEIKKELCPTEVQRDPWADVWELSKEESGLELTGSEKDLFIIELSENSAGGYRWELSNEQDELNIVYDSSNVGDNYGSPSSRTICFKFNTPSVHSMRLVHKRPWNDESNDQINYQIDNRGRETKGLPRRVKSQSLTGVVA